MPAGFEIADAKLYRSDYRLALDLKVKVQKGKTYTFDKFVAASRADWGGDAKADLALAKSARNGGFDKLLDAHRAAWRELWRSDIVIDGDAAAQTLAHSDLYYLLSASTPDTRWSIGACAMTPGYSGHIFWDADTWIFPALLLLHPERAKSLVDFRAHTLPAAQARAREAGFKGAKYPWEADAENGTEQTPHPAHVLGEREIHINADVAIAQWQYWLATHDREWLKKSGWPVIRNLADFWASRATWKADANRYEIEHVTSVAESYNDVPNDTFTNASAQKVLRIAAEAAALVGEKADPHWAEVADKLYIPFSETEQRHYDFDPRVPREPWEGSTLGAADVSESRSADDAANPPQRFRPRHGIDQAHASRTARHGRGAGVDRGRVGRRCGSRRRVDAGHLHQRICSSRRSTCARKRRPTTPAISRRRRAVSCRS